MTIKQFCKTGYTIEDHPDTDLVYDWIRNNWHDLYSWGSENVDSLNGFCDYFNLADIDYSVSTCSYSCATAKITDDDISKMSYIRLWKYLNNNYDLDKLLAGDCLFTGYCFDENLLDQIREFIKRPSNITFQELIDGCLSEWVTAYINDWEYTYTDEAIYELCESNEYMFSDAGEII